LIEDITLFCLTLKNPALFAPKIAQDAEGVTIRGLFQIVYAMILEILVHFAEILLARQHFCLLFPTKH
jgi:hypothetical protein